MPTVLLCAARPLDAELRHTSLWRSDVELLSATTFERAFIIALAGRPHLIVIDRDMPDAARLVEDLRHDAATRNRSIVVVAHGELADLELQMIEAGANAVLRLPAGPDCDRRLSELMCVPVRRAKRVPAVLTLEGWPAFGLETFSGTVVDMSVTGMLLETLSKLRVGNELRFGLLLPNADEPVSGSGQVVREAASDRFGVRFAAIENQGLDLLRRFVAEGASYPAGYGTAN
jgi:CheY-like chemotaxis protein